MSVDFGDLEQQHGLPDGLLAAVQQQESGGDPNAISSKGALGAFQFEPATAKQYGIDPTDPDQAAQGAAAMFGDLSKKYNRDIPSMLAAYNWGQGNLDKKGMENVPAETQNYIKNITSKLGGGLPQGTQYAAADTGNMSDAMVDAPDYSKMSDADLLKLVGQSTSNSSQDYSKMSDADLLKLVGQPAQQTQGLIDALKNPPDTSFVSNYGQGFLDTANRSRIGIEGLGQAAGKAVFGENPQDAAEEASRKASLAQLDKEKANSGVVPSGFGGVTGNIAGSIAGNPASWLPMGEINGIGDLARAGAIQGGGTGLIQNTDKTSLGLNLLNAGIGAGEGAASAVALGKLGKTALEIPGGISNRFKGAFGADTIDAIAAQSDKNWENASNYFKSSADNGALIKGDSAQNILSSIKSAVGNLGSRHTDTAGVLTDFEKTLEGGDISPDKLHDFRQDLNDVISTNTKSKIDGGGINADGQRALVAKKALDDSLAGISEKDLSAGTPQAINDLQQGINETARAYRYDKISQMVKNSEGDPSALQRSFQNFTKNDSNKKGFSDDEWAALKDVATRGTGQQIERALGTFGLDFGKTKNIALPVITSGSSAVVPGGIPLTAAGTILRQTGKYAARGKAQTALDTIMDMDVNELPEIIARPELPEPPKMQGTASDYINPNAKTSKSLPKKEIGKSLDNLTWHEPELPEPQGTASDYFAKGGIVKNREIHLSKKLEVKLGRQPKAREVELASYVGAHGVHRLLNQKDISMPAYKMFPQETVKQKRELFFNGRKPYSVEHIHKALG